MIKVAFVLFGIVALIWLISMFAGLIKAFPFGIIGLISIGAFVYIFYIFKLTQSNKS